MTPQRLASLLGGWAWLACLAAVAAGEEKKVFSGPQPGEKLPPLKVKGVYGDEAGKSFDYVQLAGGKPTVLIFMHKLTRPSAAVTRTILNYCGQKNADRLFSAMVFLTGDLTQGEKRLQQAQQVFKPKKNERIGISPDGQEGPGAYGLNRNMTLTILVANKGRVTANFALVQPSVQADVLKVIREVVKLTGDEMPQLADLFKNRYAAGKKKQRRARDAVVTAHIRSFIQRNAKPEDVDKIAKLIEDRVKKEPKAKADVAYYAGVILRQGYGSKRAQEIARRWAREYGPPHRKPKTER